jgi:hypothetical protein
MTDNQCTYCGQIGHRASKCPTRPVDSVIPDVLADLRTNGIRSVQLLAKSIGADIGPVCRAVERLQTLGEVRYRNPRHKRATGFGWEACR